MIGYLIDQKGFVLVIDGSFDTLKLNDTDDTNTLSLVWNEDDSSDRTLNFLVAGGDRSLTLNENLTIGDGSDVTITAEDAAGALTLDNCSLEVEDTVGSGNTIKFVIGIDDASRTVTLSENLTVGDGYDVTLQALGQAGSLILNESLTIGDGNDGTLTFSASGDTLTVGETLTLDGASGKTLTLEENLTIADGTDITIAGVTQANTLTLHESLTLGDGNDGTLTYSAASKTLTVEDNCALNQNLRTTDKPTFGSTVSTNFLMGVQVADSDEGELNVMIGYRAGRYNDTTGAGSEGDDNVFIGYEAGRGDAGGNTGYYNVAIGSAALNENISGNNNVALGLSTLKRNTTGVRNMAIGVTSLTTNVDGDDNVAIGESALRENSGSSDSVAIGSSAMYKSTEGSNVAIGVNAMSRKIGGQNNVAIGHWAGIGTVGADYDRNTMIGAYAGQLLDTGDYNILIGFQTGDILTTGSSNIIIGYDLDPSANNASSEINIGGVYKGVVATSASIPVPTAIGDGGTTNYAQFAADGDITFLGTAGLVFGSCYGNEIDLDVIDAAADTWYNLVDASMADGNLHKVTHDGNGKLTVTEPGMYLVSYGVTLECDTINTHVVSGIEVSGSGSANAAGQQHYQIPNVAAISNSEFTLSSSAILDLADNATIEAAIMTDSVAEPDFNISHINITVVQVGGT